MAIREKVRLCGFYIEKIKIAGVFLIVYFLK